MRVDVKLAGADELAASLRKLPDVMSFKVQTAALKAGAEPIRATAAALAPRDEEANAPHMADNIIIDPRTASEVAKSTEITAEAIVDVGPARPFFYGYFYEIGTAHQPARAFMRPAFDSNVTKALAIARAHVWAAIRKHLAMGGGRSATGGNL